MKVTQWQFYAIMNYMLCLLWTKSISRLNRIFRFTISLISGLVKLTSLLFFVTVLLIINNRCFTIFIRLISFWYFWPRITFFIGFFNNCWSLVLFRSSFFWFFISFGFLLFRLTLLIFLMIWFISFCILWIIFFLGLSFFFTCCSSLYDRLNIINLFIMIYFIFMNIILYNKLTCLLTRLCINFTGFLIFWLECFFDFFLFWLNFIFKWVSNIILIICFIRFYCFCIIFFVNLNSSSSFCFKIFIVLFPFFRHFFQILTFKWLMTLLILRILIISILITLVFFWLQVLFIGGFFFALQIISFTFFLSLFAFLFNWMIFIFFLSFMIVLMFNICGVFYFIRFRRWVRIFMIIVIMIEIIFISIYFFSITQMKRCDTVCQ